MKTSRRNFLKATATGMSTAALTGLGSVQAETNTFWSGGDFGYAGSASVDMWR